MGGKGWDLKDLPDFVKAALFLQCVPNSPGQTGLLWQGSTSKATSLTCHCSPTASLSIMRLAFLHNLIWSWLCFLHWRPARLLAPCLLSLAPSFDLQVKSNRSHSLKEPNSSFPQTLVLLWSVWALLSLSPLHSFNKAYLPSWPLPHPALLRPPIH